MWKEDRLKKQACVQQHQSQIIEIIIINHSSHNIHRCLYYHQQHQHSYYLFYYTSNVTGRHRGPKRKFQAAYIALRVYSKFGHHPHPLGYLCAKFCLFHSLHGWVSQWRIIVYSINHSHSLTQLIWCPGNQSFCFGIKIPRVRVSSWMKLIDQYSPLATLNTEGCTEDRSDWWFLLV